MNKPPDHGPGRSRTNRVAQTDRQPDGATKPRPPANQKARTCDTARFPISRKAKRQPCQTGRNTCGPRFTSEPARSTRSCSFFNVPNARAKGRGRTKLGETGQSITPRPLERRVGRRTRKKSGSWLFALFVGRNAMRRARPYMALQTSRIHREALISIWI